MISKRKTTPKKKGIPKKNVSNKGLDIFDILNDITRDQKGIVNESNQHSYNKWMVMKFLSRKTQYLKAAEYLNHYFNVLDNIEFHNFAMSLMGCSTRFVLNRGEKVIIRPDRDAVKEEVKYISQYYKVSLDTAYDYYLCIPVKKRKTFINDIKLIFGIVE